MLTKLIRERQIFVLFTMQGDASKHWHINYFEHSLTHTNN